MLDKVNLKSSSLLAETLGEEPLRLRISTLNEKLYSALGCTMQLPYLVSLTEEEAFDLICKESTGTDIEIDGKFIYEPSEHDNLMAMANEIGGKFTEHMGFIRNIVVKDIEEFYSVFCEKLATIDSKLNRLNLFNIEHINSNMLMTNPVYGAIIRDELSVSVSLEGGTLPVEVDVLIKDLEGINQLYPNEDRSELILANLMALKLVIAGNHNSLSRDEFTSVFTFCYDMYNNPAVRTPYSPEAIKSFMSINLVNMIEVVKKEYNLITSQEQQGYLISKINPTGDIFLAPVFDVRQKVPTVTVLTANTSQFTEEQLEAIIGTIINDNKRYSTVRASDYNEDRVSIVMEAWTSFKERFTKSDVANNNDFEIRKIIIETYRESVRVKGKDILADKYLSDVLSGEAEDIHFLQSVIDEGRVSPYGFEYGVARTVIMRALWGKLGAADTLQIIEETTMGQNGTSKDMSEKVLEVMADMMTEFAFEQFER